MIIAGRAIAGFGIGSVSLLVPVYIAETSPPSIRGRLVGIFEILSQYVLPLQTQYVKRLTV